MRKAEENVGFDSNLFFSFRVWEPLEDRSRERERERIGFEFEFGFYNWLIYLYLLIKLIAEKPVVSVTRFHVCRPRKKCNMLF